MNKFLLNLLPPHGVLLAACLVQSNAATFFGPSPYLSRDDIPPSLYLSGAPTVLENFEDGKLEPTIIASAGNAIPPGFEGLIDSVDADDGAIDGSGSRGHSWFVIGVPEVKFTFPPGTIAAGFVWTDGSETVSFTAFGPGNLPLGKYGPFNGFADANSIGTTAEDRFFGVRDAAGIESIVITISGAVELDHIQYELGAMQNQYVLDGFELDLGSGTVVGDGYVLTGGISLASAEPMLGGTISLTGEFVGLIAAEAAPVPATIIFNNSGGLANSYEFATTNSWLANRLCLGSQAYQLDEVTLLLDTRDPAKKPVARLRIYSNDPVSGRPMTDLNVVMNLSGATNPITFKLANSSYETPITWVPETPFVLSPNTCYWAVLSTEEGEIFYAIGTVVPSGPAGVFGRASSSNGGGSWGPSDNTTNRRMMIRGTPVAAPIEPAKIFDNTDGGENGGIGASATTWLASKFCLGSSAYDLKSLSLLLSNGRFDGRPTGPSNVRLQIFTHDATTGKPAANTGVSMTLSDLTNSFPVGSHQWVKWTNSSPFRLSANTCYWAVFSVESGATVGLFASFSQPTGDAATLGQTRSVDSGATWGTPDGSSNFKMLVQGTPSTTLARPLLVGVTTPIPRGTGNFASLYAPSLSANNLAFYGAGSGGQTGIYLADRVVASAPVRIADLATPIPGGIGSFHSFGSEAGIIIVSGNTGIFTGTGSGGQQGVYAAIMAPPQIGVSFRIADTATPIPGGAGMFTEFSNRPDISGNNAVFAGSGADGQRGIYAAIMAPPQVGSPFRVADTSVPVPGGTGNLTEFPNGLSVSGNTTVFAANGSGGQKGVYAAVMAPPQVSAPLRIADTATPVPGGFGNFTSFGSEAGIIIVSGKNTAFAGGAAGGQKGIYGARLLSSGLRALSLDGSDISSVSAPFVIADTSTPILGGIGNFTNFGEVSLDGEVVAFLGEGISGQAGIYARHASGDLFEVISVGDTFKGRTIAALEFSRGGLSSNEVAFQATFSDGTQGIDSITLPARPPEPFSIAAVEKVGNGLKLSFPSIAGETYAVQRRASLSSGAWADLSGVLLTGTGDTLQVTLPTLSAESQQFYRVWIIR